MSVFAQTCWCLYAACSSGGLRLIIIEIAGDKVHFFQDGTVDKANNTHTLRRARECWFSQI